jgi:hypothetical protein
MKVNFANWLESQLEERGWKPADLAKEMGDEKKYSATISRVLSEQRGVGDEVCRRIAHALNLPQAVVFYQAGLLTEHPAADGPEDERLKQIARRAARLSDDRLSMLEQYVAFLEQGEREKVKREAKKIGAAHGANK